MKKLAILLALGVLLGAMPVASAAEATSPPPSKETPAATDRETPAATEKPNAWEEIKEGASHFAENIKEGAINIAEDVGDAFENARDYFSGVGTAARLKDATEGNFEGIKVEAALVERSAILPGSAFRVNVAVTNGGERDLYYRMGSGSYTVPDALFIAMDKLQVIPSEDRMKTATMDMQIKVLMPGESMQFDFYVLAAQPKRDLQEALLKLYASGSYAGTLSAEEIAQKLPEANAVTPGNYSGDAYFMYYLGSEEESADDHVVMIVDDTKEYYAKTSFTISITE